MAVRRFAAATGDLEAKAQEELELPAGSDRGNGVVVVTGAAEDGAACQVFCDSALGGRSAFHIRGPIASLDDVDKALEKAASLHPGQAICGLVHFGGASSSTAPVSSGLDAASTLATTVLDDRLRVLTLLVARIAPMLQASGQDDARIVTISSESALQSPSEAAGGGQRMQGLANGFLETYTEALAHELKDSGIAVYTVRLTQAAAQLAASDSSAPAAELRQLLATQLADAFSLPSAETHGQVLGPVGLPSDPLQENSTRGGSVIGPSIDVNWALRAAVGRAADYPTNGRPSAYAELATALGTPADTLVWCHGASDVIVRVVAAACARAREGESNKGLPPKMCRVIKQGPTWPNVESLLRSGGADMERNLPYPDPWSSGTDSSTFWDSLEREVSSSQPPEMVYLVHPHFPTGFKEPDFGSRLQRIVNEIQRTSAETIVAVDETYMGFTEHTADDELVEKLALESKSVVIIRSLSKVEGLAAVRLGYALTCPETARELTGSLPFNGALYISELSLAGAVAAVCGKAAESHRQAVLRFYSQEQAWFRDQLQALGVEAFAADAPYFMIRGPEAVLKAAGKEGAAVQRFFFADDTDTGRSPAVVLVADRASNEATIRALEKALIAEKEKIPGVPDWAQGFLKPLVNS